MVGGNGPFYGGRMAQENEDATEPDIMAMFDTDTDTALVCRVCGSLVAAAGAYAQAHWDWHEATNGA